MPEAVIVAATRTPIGRANKGSLVACRPDDLSAARGEGGARPGARRSTRPRSRTCCGAAASPPASRATTWPRVVDAARRAPPGAGRHREPLLLLVAADDPHGGARHQGRRGRHVRRRRRRDGQPLQEGHVRRAARHPQPGRSPTPRPARRRGTAGGQPPWTPEPGARPTCTSRWVRPPRTSPRRSTSPARRWTSSRSAPSSAPSRRRRTGSSSARSRPVTAPDGTLVERRRRPAPRHDAREARVAPAGVPSRRDGHRGQRVPAERRRGGDGRDERHPRRAARHHAARPGRRRPGVTAIDPEIMGLGPIEASRQALAPRRADDRRDRPRRDQRGVRRAGRSRRRSTSACRGRS